MIGGLTTTEYGRLLQLQLDGRANRVHDGELPPSPPRSQTRSRTTMMLGLIKNASVLGLSCFQGGHRVERRRRR